MFGKKKRIIEGLKKEIEDLEEKLEKTEKRLRRAGSIPYEYIESDKIMAMEFEVKGVQYGNYITLANDDFIIDSILESAKQKATEALAEGLIKCNAVQFIVKDSAAFDPLNQSATVAVKICMIPWEETTRGFRVKLAGL